MLTLTIDGKKAQAQEGSTILEASQEMGIEIPTLCHHPQLAPYGACRLCTVEVGRASQFRLQASCAYPAEEGIEVRTNTDRVLKGRKMMAELLLARAPGVKVVQETARKLGVEKTRFPLKNETCVLCGLCVRACHELVAADAISFSGRGVLRKVEMAFEEVPEQCLGCGACTFICPTGNIQMEANTKSHWRDVLSWESRYCRYMRMGIFSHKVCPNAFECYRCEVDQRMEDLMGTHPVLFSPPAQRKIPVQVQEFQIIPELYYSRAHLWLSQMDGHLKIGIDDFARKITHSVDNFRTLAPGSLIGLGEILGAIQCADKNLSLPSPLTGRIVSINPHLEVDSPLISRDPYQRGWLLIMEPENRETLERFKTNWFTRREALSWFEKDVEKLYAWSDPQTQAIAADGGKLISALPSRLNHNQWSALVKEFFGV